MVPERSLPIKSEFYSRSPGNHLLVENHEDGGVVIRAAIDNFSEKRKEFFIRELASEGFIADEFQFLTGADGDKVRKACWIIDRSWQVLPPEIAAMSHRLGWEMFLRGFVVIMAAFDGLFLRHFS